MIQEKKIEIAQWLLDPDRGNTETIPYLSFNILEERLKHEGLWRVFSEVEVPLHPILEDMHKAGIKLQREKLEEMHKELFSKENILGSAIKKECSHLAPRVNINSPRQLGEILFSEPPRGLGITHENTSKTKSGGFSTDNETLTKIKDAHPIIPLILEYREVFKLRSTYLESFKSLMDETGRIHTTFIQDGAATGRLSSRNPNMQNIPSGIRSLFVPEKGYFFLSLDYSQIELRILASVTGDARMIDAFMHNKDIHVITAARVFHKDINAITKEERNFAKILNFGIIYGMGKDALSRLINVSRDEAEKMIRDYFNDFAHIKRWQEKLLDKAMQMGYVENELGRKRWLPGIVSQNKRVQNEARRAAVNMPIQGLGADILKLAMIRVAEILKAKKVWMKTVLPILTIHDELLFEVHNDILKEISGIIKGEMESIYELKVPLKVDVSSADNWGAL